jgi:hypothetical protein
VLFVLRRFTDSDYHFGIFKLFLKNWGRRSRDRVVVGFTTTMK